MPPAGFLRVLSGEIVFFRRNSQHYRESDVPCRQSAVFYHQNDRPEAPGGPPASHGGENRGHAPPKQTPEHGFHSLGNPKDYRLLGKKALPKCTPEHGFGNKSPRRRSAGSGPPPRRPKPHCRIGVPHAIRATRVSDPPPFYGPATKERHTGGHCVCQGAATLRRAASIIRGDHRNFNIYIY